MDPGRWQKVQELFALALETPEAQRGAFLAERAGGDEDLVHEVETLLEAESGSDSFLGRRIDDGYDLLEKASGSPPPIGAITRAGKYELVREIGHGGFGTVFEGLDPDLRRPVAIKTCTSRDAAQRERFFREGRIAAGLCHPNVVRIHDVGFEGDVPYLVQEYLPGRDLSELIAEGSLSTAAKLEVLAGIAAGLAYAHGQGVLHRDVKPSNVRVLGDGTAAPGRVKILDFGIARLLHGTETRLTQAGAMLGTMGYLAPEQLTGGRVDPRADVFSFGVLAYELLSGVRPFTGEDFGTVSYRMLYTEPEPLHEVWPECPDRRLSAVVGRCLEKALDRRPSSIEEVAAALREAGRPSLIHGRMRAGGLWLGGLATLAAVPVVVAIWLGARALEELPRGEPAEALRSEAAPLMFQAPAVMSASPSREPDERRDEEGGDETPPGSPASEPEGEAKAVEEDTEDDGAKDPVQELETQEDAGPVGPLESTERSGVDDPPDETDVEPREPPPGMRFGDPITGPGPGVVPPKMIERVEPVYPKRARRRRLKARVIVAVYVDETGRVVNTLLKQKDDSGLGFNEAAVEAARVTRFEPARRDGVAGCMWTQIPYDFSVTR